VVSLGFGAEGGTKLKEFQGDRKICNFTSYSNCVADVLEDAEYTVWLVVFYWIGNHTESKCRSL